MNQQVTIGEHFARRAYQLQHLACGVPEEYAPGLEAQADVLEGLAADWEEPQALEFRTRRNDPSLLQRCFYEVSPGFFG